MELKIKWPFENIKAGSNEVAVLIDVLRASSSITVLMQCGAEWVRPIVDVKAAREIASKENMLLMGERECVKLEGFDFGNSPTEILNNSVENKKVVFTSSNFPKTMAVAENSSAVFIGSMLNITAVTKYAYKYASENGYDICYVPAGANGEQSDEDTAFAGASAKMLKGRAEYSEQVQKAIGMVDEKGTNELIRKSKHAEWLFDLGFGDDVEFCCKKDIYKTVSILENGKIQQIS